MPAERNPRRDLRVAIIGTGFSGLAMAIKLKEAGVESFTLFERAAEVGGTWRDNTYPGCACDIPSHLYSFSFEQNPNWSRKFPPQAEIFDYLKGCADRYGIRAHIRFGAEIAKAAFDERHALWTLTTKRGETFTASVLVNGSGPLSRPAIPELPGLDDFRGRIFHSAAWDHDYDLAGKRVAVIGTGASAIQFVPAIAPLVERLHVFQRTPPWILPKPDRAFLPWEKRLFARSPALRRLYRSLIYWRLEIAALGFLGNRRFMRMAERMARRHLEGSISDPDLREKLTPDYEIGCKRILLSNDYYPALARPNVELVTEGIARVSAGGIVGRDGRERPVDAIILGTGFNATEFLGPMEVLGVGGRELGVAWKDGAESYLGITVAGFPNFFMLIGPNTGLGHNSMVFMIESQVHYVMECIETLRREEVATLDVRSSAQHEFSAALQEKMRKTVWLTGCKSWYLTADGRNFTLWPGFTFEYWWRTRHLRRADFEVRSAGAPGRASGPSAE